MMDFDWDNEKDFQEILEIEDPELKRIALEKIFEKNKGLAIYYAQKHYRRNEFYEMDDLKQVALMALWEAIERYDVKKGAKFSTYASYFIKGKIKNFFRDKTWNIYSPKKDKEILQKYKRSCEILIANGLEPTAENLYEYSNLTEEECKIATELNNNKYMMDINSSKYDENLGLSNSELIPSTDVVMEDDIITKIILNEFLNKLNKEEEMIFIEKHIKGRNNYYIRQKTNLSYSKINRIEKRIVKKFLKEIEDKD